MIKKPIEEYVWPEKNYTDKIHDSIEGLFRQIHWRAIGLKEVEDHLLNKFKWLTVDTKNKKQLLNKLIRGGIKKLIQLGMVVECESKLSTEAQWMWAQSASDNKGYKVLTSTDEVAHNMDAVKKIRHRALSFEKVRKYNSEHPNP